MKLSTAKYLRTVEIQGSWWNVLDQARRILSGKINNRLWAEASVHDISQSVFQQDILIHLAWIHGFNKENMNEEVRKKIIFGISLALLKLQIFSILDKSDARRVWWTILKPGSLNKMRDNEKRFFYHISHWPLLLLSELLEIWFLPPELASIFPRRCIIGDYENNLSPSAAESATYSYMSDLNRDIETAQNEWNTREVERLQSQLRVIEENIRRYF